MYEISNIVVCVTSKASDQPAHTRSLIRAFASRFVKLLTEHHLEFLSLKGGCRGSSESTLVKMPHCWKSHALAQLSVLTYENCNFTKFHCFKLQTKSKAVVKTHLVGQVP